MTEIILGPPGTGKTTTLLNTVEEEMASGTRPDRIGYVSYTRKAANEAIVRAKEKFGINEYPYFRTLHSMCFNMLGIEREQVLEGKRLKDFGEHAGVKITGRWNEDGTLVGFEEGDRILHLENLARVRCRSLRDQYDDTPDNLSWSRVEQVCVDLKEYKRQMGLIDFTDMLSEFLRHGFKPQLDVLIVDEVQDLSQLQWRMVQKLSEGVRRVLVAGDDDQAIYLWAGADVNTFIDLEGDVRVLGRSWRVPPVIQKLALSILENVRHRRKKNWEPREGSAGNLEYVFSVTDTDLTGDDILILARNDYILNYQVVPELRRQGIVYERHGHSSIKPNELNVITNWERLRKGQTIPVTQVRAIYDYMSMGRGVARGFKKLPDFQDDEEVNLEILQTRGGLLTNAIWYEALDRMPPDELGYIKVALQHGEKIRQKPRVRLSTIHGAKGGQADHVVLFREMAPRSARELERNPDDEARVWYVGTTRAREQLTVVNAPAGVYSCPWL